MESAHLRGSDYAEMTYSAEACLRWGSRRTWTFAQQELERYNIY